MTALADLPVAQAGPRTYREPGGPGPGPGPAAVPAADQSGAVLAGGPPVPSAPRWDGADRQAIVQFLDGTWRLCRLVAWRQRDAGAWLCDLPWGVSGRLYQATYVYDPSRGGEA